MRWVFCKAFIGLSGSCGSEKILFSFVKTRPIFRLSCSAKVRKKLAVLTTQPRWSSVKNIRFYARDHSALLPDFLTICQVWWKENDGAPWNNENWKHKKIYGAFPAKTNFRKSHLTSAESLSDAEGFWHFASTTRDSSTPE